MSSKIFFFLPIFLFLCAACHEEKPPMSEKQLEDILYDMHKAEAYLDYNPALYSDNLFKADFHHTILAQHQVTRAEFDTALVWYVSHMDFYKKMYTQLVERFKADKEKVILQQDEIRKYISPEGDSINIWKEANTCFISPFKENNRSLFNLFKYINDINYRHGDKFYLRFRPIFSERSENESPTIDLRITYSNDSVQTASQALKSGLLNVLELQAVSYYSLNFISGTIRTPVPSSQYNPMVITDIELWRVHERREKPETTAIDSTNVQPAP